MILLLAACGAPATVDESAADTGGPSDSIGVTGNWTIDVVDPDGTVVETHEFQNEIIGWGTLGRLLIGDELVDRWVVKIWPVAGATLQSCDECVLADVTTSFDASSQTVVLEATGAPALVASDGSTAAIGEVRTEVFSTVPNSPGTSRSAQFSFHELADPILLAPGQSIQVQIRFELGAPEDLIPAPQP